MFELCHGTTFLFIYFIFLFICVCMYICERISKLKLFIPLSLVGHSEDRSLLVINQSGNCSKLLFKSFSVQNKTFFFFPVCASLLLWSSVTYEADGNIGSDESRHGVPAAHPADGSLVASGRCVAGRARWADHWFGAVGSEGLEGGMTVGEGASPSKKANWGTNVSLFSVSCSGSSRIKQQKWDTASQGGQVRIDHWCPRSCFTATGHHHRRHQYIPFNATTTDVALPAFWRLLSKSLERLFKNLSMWIQFNHHLKNFYF